MSPNDRLSPACRRLCSQNTQVEGREEGREGETETERERERERQRERGRERMGDREMGRQVADRFKIGYDRPTGADKDEKVGSKIDSSRRVRVCVCVCVLVQEAHTHTHTLLYPV